MAETLTRLVGDLGLSSRPPSLSPASSTPGSTPIPTPTSVEDVDEQEHEHEHEQDAGEAAGKGKKRRKKLTPAQKRARDEAAAAAAAPRVSSLKISRNKHMKYISSYHGPWLQLPHEVLSSFLQVNCDPTALPTLRGLMDLKSSLAARTPSPSRFKSIAAGGTSLDSASAHYPAFADPDSDEHERLPPPIDPAVFRGVSEIRKCVDEASDLAVRASSGMSAAALGEFGVDWAQQGVGGAGTRNGRQAVLSPVRQHRLRVLAVARLAQAYRIDEIAASVAVMQGTTGLDDLAWRVLKHDPTNLDAVYVQFFHEKIPSRTLAASTSPAALDGLITLAPERLEFYRTRGIVHTFKQNYPEAIRNFTTGIAQSKAARKAKEHAEAVATGKANKRKTSKPANKSSAARLAEAAAAAVSWDAADAGTANGGAGGGAGGGASVPAGEVAEGIGHEPGDDLERQLLFHRAMAHFHFACKTLEDAVLDVEEVHKPEGGLSNEGGELTLRNLGILLKDESAGLYGNAPPKKQAKYRQGLNEPNIKDKINSLLRKSLRDMERYLSYFAIWEAPPGSILEEEHKHQVPRPSDRPLTFRGRRLIHHRSLTGRTRSHDPRRPEVNANEVQEEPALLTTYHPLLIEAHFCVLLSLLLLGDFAALVPAYYKVVRLMDYLAGYPVFLEARSLNMSQFAEVLERLAISWLGPREAAGARAPMGTEKDAAREGDLPALHHLLGFYTEDFIKAVVERCERDSESDRKEEEAREMRRHFDGGRRLLENGGEAEPKESWKEYRDREEEERRKVDPSYATYNTARAEAALAWLAVVVLPEKEVAEREHAVGDDRIQAGSSHPASSAASGSTANGFGAGGSASGSSAQTGSRSASTAMGRSGSGAASGLSSSSGSNAISVSMTFGLADGRSSPTVVVNGEAPGGSASVSGKGKGKGRAVEE